MSESVQDLLFGDFMGTFGWPMIGGLQQGVQAGIGNLANMWQTATALKWLEDSSSDILGAYDANSAAALTGYNNFANSVTQYQNQITQSLMTGAPITMAPPTMSITLPSPSTNTGGNNNAGGGSGGGDQASTAGGNSMANLLKLGAVAPMPLLPGLPGHPLARLWMSKAADQMGWTPETPAAAEPTNTESPTTVLSTAYDPTTGKFVVKNGDQVVSEQTMPTQSQAKDWLGGYEGLMTSGLDTLSGIGESARADINEDYDTYGSRVSAEISDRGLGNTSLRQSMSGAVEKDRQKAITSLDESLAREKLNFQSTIGLNALSALERSLNKGTDLSVTMGMGEMDLFNSLWNNRLGWEQGAADRRLSTLLGHVFNAPAPPNWGDIGTGIANAYAAKEAAESAASSSGGFSSALGPLGMSLSMFGDIMLSGGTMTMAELLASGAMGYGAGSAAGSFF